MTGVQALKDTHKSMWEAGDYAKPAQFVLPIGPRLVERTGVSPGMEVLDVATGTGNAAIPAAAAGADVIGLDIADRLLEQAHERAARAGVEVEWVIGDAEALPFADGRFERALSTLGVQFAPRHDLAARELARVCRPGGVIGLCNWTPDGYIGRFLTLVAKHTPPPPDGASPPPLWGDPGHVERLFSGTSIELEFERSTVDFTQDSPGAFVDFMADWYGPLIAARTQLEEDGSWPELRADLVGLSERENLLGGGGFAAASDYLMVIGRKPG